MKLNQLEVISKLDETIVLLQEVFDGLVELNMGNRQFDCENSLQLELTVEKLNEVVNKVNMITSKEK